MVDFLLDENGDLQLDGTGSAILGNSNQQHKELLLLTGKGDWKENLATGVDAVRYLEGEDPSGLLTEIRKQFIADGMNVTTVQFDKNGKLLINADYTA